jgi:hypothetical protein
LVLLPLELLLAVEPVSLLLPEVPLFGWSLLELEGEPGMLEDDDELPLLSFLFIARLPLDPDGLLGVEDAVEPDELPDCERRESLPRSQADSPKVAARAAASAVRKNFFCSMSTIS